MLMAYPVDNPFKLAIHGLVQLHNVLGVTQRDLKDDMELFQEQAHILLTNGYGICLSKPILYLYYEVHCASMSRPTPPIS